MLEKGSKVIVLSEDNKEIEAMIDVCHRDGTFSLVFANGEVETGWKAEDMAEVRIDLLAIPITLSSLDLPLP